MATKRETKKANTDAILRRATEHINLKMATGELRGSSTLSQYRLGQIERINSFANSRVQTRHQLNRALSLYGRSGLSSILLRYYAPTVAQYSVLQRILRLRRRRPATQVEDFATEDYAPTSPSLARTSSTAATPTVQYEYFDEPEIVAPSPMPMAQRIVQRSETTTPSTQFANQIAERQSQKATVSHSRNFTPAVVQGLDNTVRTHRQINTSSATIQNAYREVAQPSLRANDAAVQPATQVSRQIAQNSAQTVPTTEQTISAAQISANALSVNSSTATPATSVQPAETTNFATTTEINRLPANRQSTSNGNIVSPQSLTYTNDARAEIVEREVNPSQPTPLRAALQRLESDFVSAATPQIAPALLLTHRLNRLASPAANNISSSITQVTENKNAAPNPVQRQLGTSVARAKTISTPSSSSFAVPSNNVSSSSGATTTTNTIGINSSNVQANDAATVVQATATQPTNLSDSPMYRAVARSSTQPTQNNSVNWVNRLPIIQQTLGNEPVSTAPNFELETSASEIRRSYLEPQRSTSVAQSASTPAIRPENSSNPAQTAVSNANSSSQIAAANNNANTNSQIATVSNHATTSQPTAQTTGTQTATSAIDSAAQNFGQAAVSPDATLQRITAQNVASVSPIRRAVQRLNSDFVEASPEVAPAMLLSHRLSKMLPASQSQVLTSNNQSSNAASADVQAVQRRVDLQTSNASSSSVMSNAMQRAAGVQISPSVNTVMPQSGNQAAQANVTQTRLGGQAFTISNSSIDSLQPNVGDQNFATTEANAPLNLVQRRVSNENASTVSQNNNQAQNSTDNANQFSSYATTSSVSSTPAMLRAMERTNISSSALTTSGSADWASSLPALQQLTTTEPISSNLSQAVATTTSSVSETYSDSPRRSLPQTSRSINQNSSSASIAATSMQPQNTVSRDFAATNDATSLNRSATTPVLTPIQRAFARTNSAQAISTTQQAVQQILTQSSQAAAPSRNESVKAEPNTMMAAVFERSKSDYTPTPLMQSLQRMTDQQPNAVNQQQAPNYTYTTPPLLLDMASTNYQPPKAQPTVVPTASTEGFVAGQNLPPLASQSVPTTPAIFSKQVSPMIAAEKSATNAANVTSNQNSAATESTTPIQRTLGRTTPQALSEQANSDAVVLPSRFERAKADPMAKLDDGSTALAMTQLNTNQTEVSHKIGEAKPEPTLPQSLLSRGVETSEPAAVNPNVVNRTLGQTTNPETVTPPSPLPMAQLKPVLSGNEVQENISRLLERQIPEATLESNIINRTLGTTPNSETSPATATPSPLPMPQLKPNIDASDMSEDMLLQAIQSLGKSRPEIMRRAIEKSGAATAKPIEPSKPETANLAQSPKPIFDPETFASSVPSSPIITPRFVPTIAVEGQALPLTMVQRKANGSVSNVSNSIGVIGTPTMPTIMRASGGQALPGAIQRKMSETFGAKFDHVRVHTDNQAVSSAQQMGAEAYTVGSNIFFNSGRYQPDSPSGQALIAHELTHVVQQAHLPSLGNGKVLETSTHGQNLEREAIHNEKLMLNHLTTSQAVERTRSAGETTLNLANHNVATHDVATNNVANHNSAPTPTVQRTFSPSDIVRMVQSGQLQKSGTSASDNVTSNANPTVQRIVNPVPVNTGQTVERVLGKPTEAAEQQAKQEIELGDEEVERLANKIYRMLRERLTIDRERHGIRGNIFH